MPQNKSLKLRITSIWKRYLIIGTLFIVIGMGALLLTDYQDGNGNSYIMMVTITSMTTGLGSGMCLTALECIMALSDNQDE